jgi:non-specific serine/threonine protein kinase/serine/threonine-protein kinase
MTPEHWQRLQELFNAAVELPPEQQAAFLDQACADDPALRRQAESLILASEDATQRIHGAIHEAAESVTLEETAAMVGRRIGPYQVMEELGQGGMGAVYLAVRADDEYRKRVAIKVVRQGLADPEVVRRFRNERQILASLDHPHIARLLDGGTTANGMPYVVMDYIEGKPIDQYCNSHRLTIDERLKLFRHVCAAVHYAHQNLIIHRDIKPGNILVTADGVPKLLDFGIAKLLNPELGLQTQAVTRMAMRLMTPEYASPEQIRGEPITTASDIYSLGVVLYELLTGHRPYRFKNYLPQEIEHVVSFEEPEKPSTVISRESSVVPGPWSLAKSEESGARDQGPGTRDQEKLRRRLAGELDDIVMMALRKEPQRRYASAEQLSDDIRRHLEGRPVRARPDTIGYRAAKFVKRNKVGVAAAALVLLTLIGGIVATAWQARVARAERVRAEQRFNDVRKLANSFMFEIHDAIEKLPGSTPARKLLVERALEYLDSLAKEAGNDPSLQRELATAYQKVAEVQGYPHTANLGDTAGALQSLRKALAIGEAMWAHNSNDRALRRALAVNYGMIADVLVTAGDTTGALENIRKAQPHFEALSREDPTNAKARRDLALCYEKIGDTLVKTGDRANALAVYRQALAMREALLAQDPARVQFRRDLSMSHNRIGDMMAATGDPAGALQSYRQALAMREALSAQDPTDAIARRDVTVNLNKIGGMLVEMGDIGGALKNYRQALAMREELLAADPTNARARMDLALSYDNIGRVLSKTGDAAGALENYRRALTIRESLSAQDPTNAEIRRYVAASHTFIGDVLAGKKDSSGALQRYRQAATIIERLLAQDPNDVESRRDAANVYSRLGGVYATLASGRPMSIADQIEQWRQAQSWYQRSLDVWLDMRNRSILSGADADQPDKVFQELTKSKMALTKLQGH